MDIGNSVPFPRGFTLYQGDTIDTANLRGANILGQLREFPDVNPTGGTNGTPLTNTDLRVRCILLRNTSAAAILPGQSCAINGTDPSRNTSALTAATGQFFVIADEYLPAAGLAINDVGWFVVAGPTTALMATVSGAKAAGGLLVGASATSGKLDFTPVTAGSSIIAQNQAAWGSNAVTEGAIADQATSARIYINRNFFGQ